MSSQETKTYRPEKEAIVEEIRRGVSSSAYVFLADYKGLTVARAAERGDPLPARMVDRWCGRVSRAVAEEVARLALGDRPAVVVYGGLLEASPWLGERIREAVLAGAPHARLLGLAVEPAEGAAALAIDAWTGRAVAGWAFTPRR